jgi:hypothetical protein
MDVASGTLPSRAPTRWPWLNQILAACLVVMVALFLGFLSLAAVREMTVKCRDEPIYITTVNGDRLTLEDGTTFLVAEQKRRECRLVLGDVGIPLPVLPTQGYGYLSP